ncbi:MAG: hypothetical protein AB7G17_01215 [Phycisphaerales bacterium]
MLTRAFAAALLLSSSLPAQPLPQGIPLCIIHREYDDRTTRIAFLAWSDGSVLYDATPLSDDIYLPAIAKLAPDQLASLRATLQSAEFRELHGMKIESLDTSSRWSVSNTAVLPDPCGFSWDGCLRDGEYEQAIERIIAFLRAIDTMRPDIGVSAPADVFLPSRCDPIYPGVAWPLALPPLYPWQPLPDTPELPNPINSVRDSERYVRAMSSAVEAGDHTRALDLLQALWPALTAPPHALRNTGHLLPPLAHTLTALVQASPEAREFLSAEHNRLASLLDNPSLFDADALSILPHWLCLRDTLEPDAHNPRWPALFAQREDNAFALALATSFWPVALESLIHDDQLVPSRRNVPWYCRSNLTEEMRLAWTANRALSGAAFNRDPQLDADMDAERAGTRRDTAALYLGALLLHLDQLAADIAQSAVAHDPRKDAAYADLVRFALEHQQPRAEHFEWLRQAKARGAYVDELLPRLRNALERELKQNQAATP